MPKKHPAVDRNFDPLSSRFKRNIYDSPKGKIRLAVLQRDFLECLPLSGRRVLDLGAGQGQFARFMLEQGAAVTLVDHSQEMLAHAQSSLGAFTAVRNVKFVHSDLWSTDKWPARFDVITCHAVLEWLENPLDAIRLMSSHLPLGGHLSLMFYNLDGLVYKNLLRANYKKVINQDFRGQRGSLTPNNPLKVSEVLKVLEDERLTVMCHSGVRCFHDYIFDREAQAQNMDQALELELVLSRQPPFRDLGRYVHLLLKKNV